MSRPPRPWPCFGGSTPSTIRYQWSWASASGERRLVLLLELVHDAAEALERPEAPAPDVRQEDAEHAQQSGSSSSRAAARARRRRAERRSVNDSSCGAASWMAPRMKIGRSVCAHAVGGPDVAHQRVVPEGPRERLRGRFALRRGDAVWRVRASGGRCWSEARGRPGCRPGGRARRNRQGCRDVG